MNRVCAQRVASTVWDTQYWIHRFTASTNNFGHPTRVTLSNSLRIPLHPGALLPITLGFEFVPAKP